MAGTKTETKTKSKTAAEKASHPTYEKMIRGAITAMNERNDSSRYAIKKYVSENYEVTTGPHFDVQIKEAIKSGFAKGVFSLPKGHSNSVKLSSKSSTATPKKSPKAKSSTGTTKKVTATKKKADPATSSTTTTTKIETPTKRAVKEEKTAPAKRVKKTAATATASA